MVHRIPEQGSGEFKVGSQLIVRENQWAVFFRDGKAYDVFGAGRHTLATQNIPLLTAALTTPLFGDTPFRCEVYFVSQRTFTDLKWGTAEPILFRDSEFKMIRLRSNGIYTFQITDPKLFVLKIVGTRGIFTNGQIEDFLRGIIVGRLSDILGETLDSVLDLPRYFDELGAGLKARIKDDFAQYGLAIVDFIINAITPPDEVQKRIDERSGMEAVGGMDRYFQFKAAQAIGDLAQGRRRRRRRRRRRQRHRLGGRGRSGPRHRRRPGHDDPGHAAAGHGRRRAAQDALPQLQAGRARRQQVLPQLRLQPRAPPSSARSAAPPCPPTPSSAPTAATQMGAAPAGAGGRRPRRRRRRPKKTTK